MRTPLRKCLGTHGGGRTADAFMRVSVPVSPRTIMRAGGAATWLEARGRGGSFRSRALPNPPAPSRGQELPFFFSTCAAAFPLHPPFQLQPSRKAPAAPRAPAHRPRQEGWVRSNRSELLNCYSSQEQCQFIMPVFNSTQLKKGGKKSS